MFKQKSIKTEKEGEEKVKKTRFPSILGPQRRPSRIEASSGQLWLMENCPQMYASPEIWHAFFFLVGKALDGRPRPQKQMSQPSLGASEHTEGGRLRVSQSSEGPELVHSMSVPSSSPSSATFSFDSSRDTDMGTFIVMPLCWPSEHNNLVSKIF